MRKIFPKYRFYYLRLIAIVILLLFLFDNYNAQSSSVKTITYQNETVRELAKKYLNNPNYWETILQYNNLESVSELEPGMKILIPTGLVLATDEKIVITKNKISAANNNGARIFTPELITKAEESFNKVLTLKKQGEWQTAYDTLQDAYSFAKKSFNKVQLLRKISADATISFTKGNVEKRKSSESIWNDAELFSKLYEADRARTLSNSLAEITFIDLSKIRLNENSQAVIQHSRIDVLKNKTETKVKLVKGDAFAYLMKSPKKKFDIDVPGLEAIINSKSFWIEKKNISTKIANYDGEIELSAKDVVVVVKENQGSIIPDGGTPSEPLDLLPSPELLTPENDKKYFKNSFSFTWEKVKSAKKYWLEISSDVSFQKLVLSKKGIKKNSIKIYNLNLGVFYWHVCSIDNLGLPGEFSEYKSVIVSKDNIDPFLIVSEPKDMEAIKLDVISVIGESEPGLKLQINNSIVDVDESGKFDYELPLVEGSNLITIISTDAKGNKSKVLRTVFYESNKKVENRIINKNYFINNNTFITNSSELVCRGKTRPLSSIKISFGKNKFTSYADSNGLYTFKLNVTNSESNFNIIITTPAGFLLSSKYKIIFDNKNPVLNINTKIPKFTNSKSIKLTGSIFEGDSLFINSKLFSFSKNVFSKIVELKEGNNKIEIVAKDKAGNSTNKSIFLVKDSEPPKLLEHKIVKNKKNRNEYLIQVTASDNSNLTKVAIVNISINKSEQNITLLLNGNNKYEKRFFANSKNSDIAIKSISLADYIGNSKTYILK